MAVVDPTSWKNDIRKMAFDLEHERKSTMGPVQLGATYLGRIWGAMLSQWLGQDVGTLPPFLVNLMFAAAKLERATRRGRVVLDDYVDALNYTKFAWDGAATPDQAYAYGENPPESPETERTGLGGAVGSGGT